MRPDEFEQRLQRQPLRAIPAGWRREILGNAEAACPGALRHKQRAARVPWWRELLWPCPQAWAGLAAVWVVILAFNLALREPAHVTKTSNAVPAPQILIALREHRRLLAELVGSPTDLEPPKRFDARRRGEISNPTLTVRLA